VHRVIESDLNRRQVINDKYNIESKYKRQVFIRIFVITKIMCS